MRLSELLEEQSIKSISLNTMISEDNIQKVISEEYTGLTKAKALGFLSILEREYNLDLKDVRNNAISYFDMHQDNSASINIALPRVEEKKGRSKWFILLMLGLLGYASWYFFTQFDKKGLNDMLPFGEDKVKVKGAEHNDSIWGINSDTPDENVKQTSVPTQKPKEFTSAVVSTVETQVVQKHTEVMSTETAEASAVNIPTQNTVVLEEKNDTNIETIPLQQYTQNNVVEASSIPPQSVIEETQIVDTVSREAVIRPVKRLWFGMVNMRTGKRDHFLCVEHIKLI